MVDFPLLCLYCIFKKKMMAPSKIPPPPGWAWQTFDLDSQDPILVESSSKSKAQNSPIQTTLQGTITYPTKTGKTGTSSTQKSATWNGIKKSPKRPQKKPLVFICIFLLRQIFYVSYLAYGIMKLATVLGGTGIARMPTWHFLLFFQFLFHQRSKRLPGFL